MIDILNDFLQGFQTLKLCLACQLSFVEQASWSELASRGGLSDQKIKKGTFVRVEKVSS